MAEEPDKDVKDRLDLVIRLLALSLAYGKTRREQISLLSRAGLQPRDIAELIETTPGTVSVELSRMRADKPRRRGPRRKEPSHE